MKQYTDSELLDIVRGAKGAPMNYPGGDPRLNMAGDVLDFGDGVDNFQLKGHKNRQFTMIIENANVATRIARLYGGYNQFNAALVPGLVTDGAFNDINGNAGLTGTSGNASKTIQEFLNYILFNPSRVPAIKVLSTVNTQITEVLSLDTLTPFRATTQSQEVYPANEQNEYTFQNNTAVLATNFQLSNQENVTYPIVGSSTARLTWFMGASYNTALALQRMAKRAQEIDVTPKRIA